MARDPSRAELEKCAAAWLARRESGLSDEERRRFAAWQAADPRHAAAVAAIESAWSAFDRPVAEGRGEALRARLAELDRRSRRRLLLGGAGLAAAACFALVARLHLRPPPADSSGEGTARLLGPAREVLSDGSVVERRPGATFAAAFDGRCRRLVLREGEAYFSVEKEARPFVVEAGSVRVRAVGTAFSVQFGPRGVEVLVTSGRVAVAVRGDHAGGETLVAAGQLVVVDRAGGTGPAAAVSAEELQAKLAWRQVWLDFTDATVAEAVVLFNRHNGPRLRADAAVADCRVTGMFRPHNVDGFVQALQTTLKIEARPLPDGTIVLKRRP